MSFAATSPADVDHTVTTVVSMPAAVGTESIGSFYLL